MQRAYSILTFTCGAMLVHACSSNPISSGAGGAAGKGAGGNGSGGSGSGGAKVTATGGAGSGGVSASKASGGSGGVSDAAIGSGGSTVSPNVGGSVGSTVSPNVGGSGGSTVNPNVGGSGGSTVNPPPGGSGGSTVKPNTGGSGGSTLPPNTGGSGGSTAREDAATDTGTMGIDAGTGGTAGCDKDLSGTWDLYTTSLASGSASAMLVLGANGFTFTTRTGQLAYTATGTLSAAYKTSSGTRVLTVQNTPASVNSGSFPLALGGHWTLASNHETCTLDVAAGTVKGKCNGRPNEYNVAADDWPYVIPSPENGLNYVFTRTSALASQFGDFGGQWTAKSDTGSGQGCAFKVEGNTFTSTCMASNDFNGTLHLTIGSDCVASGTTPSGLEVSGRRR